MVTILVVVEVDLGCWCWDRIGIVGLVSFVALGFDGCGMKVFFGGEGKGERWARVVLCLLGERWERWCGLFVKWIWVGGCRWMSWMCLEWNDVSDAVNEVECRQSV